MIFGLLLAICWVPTYTGASIMTQWAVMSCLLPLAVWRSSALSLPHWLGVGFLAYAFLSILWAQNLYDAGWQLWLLTMVGLSFWLGASMKSLRRLLIGLSLGLTISSLLCLTQWYGWNWPPHREAPAGLLFNGAVLGATLSMVITGLACYREWRYIPLLIPGLLLCGSRGALIATGVGVFATFVRRPLVLLLLLLLGLFAATLGSHVSDNDRLFHWRTAYEGITWFGHGVGSFLGVVIQNTRGDEVSFSPAGAAHNDYLQLAFEFGIGALPLYALYLLTLAKTSAREWPIFVVFAISGIWFFPLYLPITAFLGALVAGRISRDWILVGHVGYHGGLDGVSRKPSWGSEFDQSRSGNLPSLT